MKHRYNLSRLAGIGVIALLATISARADEVYSYVGPTFEANGYSCGITTFNGQGCTQLRDDNITSSIDLVTALGANYDGIVSAAAITSWSMTSAGATISNTNGGQDFYASIATDGSGNIIDWAVFSDSGLGGGAMLTSGGNDGNVTTPWALSGSDDSLYAENCATAYYGCQTLAIVSSASGTWSSAYVPPVAETPEPIWDCLIALSAFIPAGIYQRRRHNQRRQDDLEREIWLVSTQPAVLRSGVQS